MTSRRPTSGAGHAPNLNGSSKGMATADVPESLVPMLERAQRAPAENLSVSMASSSRGQRGSAGRSSADWHRAHPEPEDADDDERVPIPTAWRTRPEPAPPSWLAHQIKAGMFGLALGLVLVIPTVLWLTGRFGAAFDPQSVVTSAVSPQESSQERPATAEMAPTLAVQSKTAARAASEEKNDDAVSELLGRAEALIADGEMQLARDLLTDSLLENNPRAAFALAETFDPNILAATGARGVRAEVERARMLYGKALAGGITLARQRLEALR
jgi:hypothetical protein